MKLFNDPNIVNNFNITERCFLVARMHILLNLHKDKAMYRKLAGDLPIDYIFFIPILDLDLSDNNNQNLTPDSTVILPHEYKNKMENHAQKKENRGTVIYDTDASDAVKEYLVSEPLQQGTVIYFRTATEKDSDDDGKSVIHGSPKIPDNFARVFIFCVGNKK